MDSTQSHLIQLHALNKEQPPPQQYNTEEIQRPAYRTRIPQPQHHTTHRRGRNHNWAIITLVHISVRILWFFEALIHHQSDIWQQTSTMRAPNSHFYFWYKLSPKIHKQCGSGIIHHTRNFAIPITIKFRFNLLHFQSGTKKLGLHLVPLADKNCCGTKPIHDDSSHGIKTHAEVWAKRQYACWLNPTHGEERRYFSYEKSSLVVQVILFDSSLVHRYIVSRTTHVQSYIVFFYKTKQS